jgi:glycosyltransferase involved in cell wall biosynthesis
MTAPAQITFVSPVYNERNSLHELVDRCRAQVEQVGAEFRMVLVDDGSTDGSREVMRQIAAQQPDVTIIFLRRHFGKSAALSVGFNEVKSGIIVTIDSDLQDQPEELPKLLDALENADLVSGRKVDRQDPMPRRVASRMFNAAVSHFAGQKFHDSNSGFKAVRAEVVPRLALEGDRHRLIMLLARWNGYRVAEVPVRHEPRRFGRSKYGIMRALSGFFDLTSVLIVERFRHRPLHFLGSIGFALFFIGAVVFGWLVVMRLLEETFLTNRPAFYFSILLMILGANFFTSGIIAELHNSRYPLSYDDLILSKQNAAADEAEPCPKRALF